MHYAEKPESNRHMLYVDVDEIHCEARPLRTFVVASFDWL